MIRKFFFFSSFSIIFGLANGQQLMAVDWQNNLTHNSYIDHVYDLETDSAGNVYTLGSFPNEAIINGQHLYGTTGEHLLAKHDRLGNLVYGINFGGTEYLDEGEMEVSSDEDITIALNFKGNFYWNDTVLASALNFTAIILKLDSSLNIQWFKLAPGMKINFAQLFTEGMVQDEAENVYACIRFTDSIFIDGHIYTNNGTSYGLVLSKFDANGTHQWTKQYQSEHGTILQKIILAYKPNITGNAEIIMAGYHSADSIYIDSTAIFLDTIGGAFVTKVDPLGNVLESIRIRNVSYIIDFGFYENRVFFAGMFYNTIYWQGGSTTPVNESVFIGEVNDSLEIIKITDLQTSVPLYLSGFNISKKYGFMIYGNYTSSLSIQSLPIASVSSYPYGVFIASFDDEFTLNQAKYVSADWFHLNRVRVRDSLIFGAGLFEYQLNFEDTSISCWNDDILVFKVNGMNQLPSFENLSLDEHASDSKKTGLFPNPSSDFIHFSGADVSNNVTVYIYDLSGKLVKETTVDQHSIDINDLQRGYYFVKLDDLNPRKLKFLKE
jgi:hypothetical protein